MSGKHYELRILPLFEDDLNEIADYITYRLRNPVAAANLVDAVEAAVYERLPNAESFEPFHSNRERKYPCEELYHFLCGYWECDGASQDYVRKAELERDNIRNAIQKPTDANDIGWLFSCPKTEPDYPDLCLKQEGIWHIIQ